MAKLYIDYEGRGLFFCPACNVRHRVDLVKEHNLNPEVGWNVSTDFPTFSRDLLFVVVSDAGANICSARVQRGQITYLEKSTHDMRGQTVELPEIEGPTIEGPT